MNTIFLSDTKRGLVCFIKANKPFKLFINDAELPEPLVEQNLNGTKQYTLNPEYVWYKIGEQDREILKYKLAVHYQSSEENTNTNKLCAFKTEEEAKKAEDVLIFRSPTINQLRWVLDLNKCKGCFPQAFWNLQAATVKFEVNDDDYNSFEYDVVFI